MIDHDNSHIPTSIRGATGAGTEASGIPSPRSRRYGRPRILIIQPTYRVSPDGPLHKTKRRQLIGLTLPYLAALTPADWDVELVDEQVQELDLNAPVDVVAITTWTITSLRAYEIAAAFRARQIPVIMGGPHTFFHADEAAQHCDAVGIGEGEDIWPQMLEDAASGRLKPVYRAEENHPLHDLPMPRYDLSDIRAPKLLRTYSVQNSRGCPFKCEFCSERFFMGERYRYRPAENVVEEIRHTGARNIFFADSMFAGKKERALELMEALIPLKIRWSTLWTTYLCLDDEFMDMAKRSGLLHVNMGMESINEETLAAMNKRFNKVDDYEAILGGLRRRGISYSLNFVFGFEGETPDATEQTLKFLNHHNVPVAYFYILGPHKGTPLYDRMMAAGQVLDDAALGRAPGIKCDIDPPYGTPAEMEQRIRDTYGRFYSLPSMIRRLPAPFTKANIASWILNLSQRRMARSDKAAKNFGRI